MVAVLSGFNTLTSFGAFRAGFPGQGTFTVNASFGLGGPSLPGTSVILPGDTLNFTLSVISQAHKALSLKLSWNVTGDTSIWGCNPTGCNDFGVFGVPSEPLTMTINGQAVLPENTVYIQNDARMAQFTFAIVQVQPGSNIYQAQISSDVVTPQVSFSTSFFASQ